MILLSFLLLVVSTYLVLRFFRMVNAVDRLLVFILIAFSQLVLILTVLGLFYAMDQPYLVLIIQAGITAALYLWHKSRRNPLKIELPRRGLPPRWLRDNLIKSNSWLLGLILVSAANLLLNLVYVFAVPPSNNDALAIHLARVGMWHQTGSWLPWNTHVVWQLTFPMNAELVSYWTLLFTKSEHLLNFFPLLCGYLSVWLVYLLCHAATKNWQVSTLSALIWAAYPLVNLNFTSARHDHVSTFLLLAAVFYSWRYLQDKRKSYLFLSGLALGLAIGTNLSVSGYLPALFIALIYLWLVTKKIDFRSTAWFAIYSLGSFLVFSSAIYISNYLHFGSLLGPDALEMTSARTISGGSGIFSHIFLMTGRWLYQLVDLQLIPAAYLTKLMGIKAWLPMLISRNLGVSLETGASQLNQHTFTYLKQVPFSEDSAWFGLLGVLIFLLVLVWLLRRSRTSLSKLMLILLITVPITFSLVRSGWTPFDGRYFMPLFAFLAVPFAMFLNEFPAKWGKAFYVFLSVLSIITIGLTIYNNPAKSFWGDSAFYARHRFDSITIQSYATKPMVYLVDQAVPAEGVLGIATDYIVYYEYGLFGERFTRKIIPVYPAERVCDPDWLVSQGIEYLLVDYAQAGYPPCSLKIYPEVKSMKDWMVLRVQ